MLPLIAMLAAPVGAVEFTVSPVQLEFEAPPGGSSTTTISVANQGDAALRVTPTTWDWWYDDDGHRFEPPGTLPTTAAPWFSAFPRALEIGAGDTGTFTLSLSVPQEVSGGYYAVCFVEAREAGLDEPVGLRVEPAGRIGVLLMVRIAGSEPGRVEVLDVSSVPGTDSTPLNLSLDLRNRGSVHALPQLRAAIRGSGGQVVGRIDSPPLRLLPDQQRSLELPITMPVPAGTWDLVGALVWDGRSVPVQHQLVIP